MCLESSAKYSEVCWSPWHIHDCEYMCSQIYVLKHIEGLIRLHFKNSA